MQAHVSKVASIWNMDSELYSEKVKIDDLVSLLCHLGGHHAVFPSTNGDSARAELLRFFEKAARPPWLGAYDLYAALRYCTADHSASLALRPCSWIRRVSGKRLMVNSSGVMDLGVFMVSWSFPRWAAPVGSPISLMSISVSFGRCRCQDISISFISSCPWMFLCWILRAETMLSWQAQMVFCQRGGGAGRWNLSWVSYIHRTKTGWYEVLLGRSYLVTCGRLILFSAFPVRCSYISGWLAVARSASYDLLYILLPRSLLETLISNAILRYPMFMSWVLLCTFRIPPHIRKYNVHTYT